MLDHPFQEFNSYNGLCAHMEYDHDIETEKVGIGQGSPTYTELYEKHELEHARLAERRRTNEN